MRRDIELINWEKKIVSVSGGHPHKLIKILKDGSEFCYCLIAITKKGHGMVVKHCNEYGRDALGRIAYKNEGVKIQISKDEYMQELIDKNRKMEERITALEKGHTDVDRPSLNLGDEEQGLDIH